VNHILCNSLRSCADLGLWQESYHDTWPEMVPAEGRGFGRNRAACAWGTGEELDEMCIVLMMYRTARDGSVGRSEEAKVPQRSQTHWQ
jgi:hypothetical protein